MRVVIADDAVILRDGLAQLLELRGHTVVAAVKDAEALRRAVAEHDPDIAVIDVRMPPTHTDEGLRAALQVRRDHPGVGIMLFSQYVETRYVKDLVAASAAGVGYLLKERVAEGGTALDPEVLPHLLGTPRGALDPLTPREREVLALMAEGRTNDAIARRLVVSGRAVEKHIANIFTKLGLPPSGDDHRRVLAVLRYLEGT